MENKEYKLSDINVKIKYSFSCIYKLTSPSGKIYIGQTQSLYDRVRRYRGGKFNKYMKRAVDKYGLENIKLEILEKDIPLELLDKREQFYLDTLQPFDGNGYNICREASTTRGVSKSEKEKLAMTERSKLRVGKLNPFYGKKHSEDSKQKQRDAKVDKKLTKSHIDSFCGAGQEAVKRKVHQIDKNTLVIIKTWDYIRQASKELKIHEGSITNACKGKYKTAGGFKWEYC